MAKQEIGSGSNGSGLGDEKTVLIIGAGKPGLSVVFPYLKEKAQGVELLMAMRALDANFRESCKVIVIGDREDWFSDEVIHISADVVSDNPQIDTLHKLKLAIADERVSDGFVWMNDDIYMISPVMLADIQVLTAQGKLARIPESKKVYEINRNKTIEVLDANKARINNYDTHTPFYFEKEKLVELFEHIDQLNSDGLLIASIYYNLFYDDHVPMQIDGKTGNYLLRLVSKNTDQATFNEFVVGKKFLNNSELGYNDVLVGYLKSKFKKKSRYEK